MCSSAEAPIDARDSEHYRAFMENPGTLVTSTLHGKASGKPVVVVSQPLYDDTTLLGFVAVSLSHDLLRSTRATSYWADGARIVTFNEQGNALAGDFADLDDTADLLPAGRSLESLIPLTDTTFRARTEGGESRFFSVVAVVPDLVYALGSWSPQQSGIVGRNVSRFAAMIFPVALWAVSLAVAYFAVYRLVLRHVRELRGQMLRFALGDRSQPPPVLTDAPGEIRDVSETFHNMARILIRDEAAMEEAVNEKTVLLKEVHHRVKNNLQLIASVISMQSRVIDDNDAKRVLRSVQDRVASLATIYKNLYQAEHLDSVEADRLMRDIIGQMSAAWVVGDQSIRVDAQIEPLTLPPDQAVPLTLLTTEAFTNSLKYAGVPEGEDRAWVRVSLHSEDDGMAVLVIENSLGDKIADVEGTGLGSQLIEAFAMQLDTEADIGVEDNVFRLQMRFRPERPNNALPPEAEDDRRVVLTSAARAGSVH